MTIEISAAHNTARLQATLTFANTGTANPTIEFYATTRPAFADAAGGSPLVVVTLAKPCGSVAGGVLSLIQADPAGDLVTVTGSPLWALKYSTISYDHLHNYRAVIADNQDAT